MPETRRFPEWLSDAGILVLRVSIGSMMLLRHGWPKLTEYGEKLDTFADPLGVGSATSLTLAVFGEFFCAALLVLGLATRFAAVPFLITMLVAALVVHADDPFARKELALVYAAPALALLLTGGGRFSLDHLALRWWRSRRS